MTPRRHRQDYQFPCPNSDIGAPSRRSHFVQKKRICHVNGVRTVPPNGVIPTDIGKSAIPTESAESPFSGAFRGKN